MDITSERYPIARLVDGRGVGIIKSLGTHFSTIEFEDGINRWRITVENDEFEIVDYITIGYGTVDG